MSTADEVIAFAQDISAFAPEPIKAVAQGLIAAARAVEAVIEATAAGAGQDELVAAVEGAMKAASDAEMKKDLAP